MKNKKLNLPVLLEFRDYHDIGYILNDFLKVIIPDIKAQEVEDWYTATGFYGAIFYTNIRDYKQLLKELKKDLELDSQLSDI